MRRLTFLTACLAAMAWQITASSVKADYASTVLADKPIGYWRFNDAGSVAVNSGTQGATINGEYVGGEKVAASSFTLVDGRTVTGLGAGNTAFRAGTTGDDYVTVADSILSDLSEFTMSAWINPGARTAGRIGLFGQNDAVEFGFISPNQIQLWTPSGNVINYGIDPVKQLPNNTWAHLAVTADGNRMRLFINGQPVNPSPSYGRSTFPFNIGGGGIYDGTGNQFTGSLDEIAVFDKALTQAQLQAQVLEARKAGGNYSATVLSAGPIGYWGLNDANGTVAINQGSAGAKLNGTYVGGDRSAAGPNEKYPGFTVGNKAIGVEAPTDGYITVPGSPLSGLAEFTLSGWVKPGSITDSRVGLFGQNDTLEFGFINPTTLQMWSPQGGYVNYPLAGEVEEDQWVHIAAVGTGQNISIYIDGEQVATGGNPIAADPVPVESYGASAFPFNMGGGGIYDGTGNQFKGILDEVAVWDVALSDAKILAHFNAALGAGLRGDFNNNGSLDAGDLDLQASAIGTADLVYDLNNDKKVDINDRRVWVNDLKKTYMGDANLNGVFNSGDLVAVFAAGKFETGQNAGWTEGDWDGDKKFGSGDFVEAFQGGGYEVGPRTAVSAVPEPVSQTLLLLGLIALRRRRK